MTPAEVERIKLIANAYDRASTACFTVGVATPVAAFVYNVSGFRNTIGYGEIALGLAGGLPSRSAYICWRDKFSRGCSDERLCHLRVRGDAAIVMALAVLLFLVDEHNHRKRRQTPGE